MGCTSSAAQALTTVPKSVDSPDQGKSSKPDFSQGLTVPKPVDIVMIESPKESLAGKKTTDLRQE